MKLIKLELNNFKKVKHFIFEPAGEDRWIFGKNGTGKTTIADAFYWVLINKTSNDKKCDEDIKLKDKNGNAMMDGGVEHRVDVVLNLDSGKTITLSKILAEKWVKANGAAKKEYTGNTTIHYIDGVKRSQKNYNAFIEKEIGSIKLLKIVSLTSYFCNMPWKKQREILTSMCGDVSEKDVIAISDELKELQGYLDGKSVNDFITILVERKRKIREQMEMLPARIDEAAKAMPDITGLSKESLGVELNDLLTKQSKVRNEIAALQNGSALAEMRKYGAELMTQMEQIKQKYNLATSQQCIEDTKKIGELENERQKLLYEIEQNSSQIKDADAKIANIEKELVKARMDYKHIYAETFDTSKANCPTCGQELPADKIAAAKEKFNLDKSSRLEQSRVNGKSLAYKKATFAENIKKLSEANSMANIKIEKLDADIALLKERSTDTNEIDNNGSYLKDDEYKSLTDKHNEITKKIISAQEDNIIGINKLRSVISQLELDITERQKKTLLFDQSEKGQARIETLKNEQHDLAAEYETIEYKLNLSQLFIEKQIEMLDEKINGKFINARFKLFDRQVNGTIIPCCEAITQEGATYSEAMSTGERLKIGLDICTTLAKHYELDIPIFVDNAEGVTDLPDTSSQQIRLVVSQIDDKLRTTKPIVKNKDAA